MRKPHKIIVLVCTLFFINTIALNRPFSVNELASPTSTNLTTNLTDLQQQLLHPTATKVGASHCYPTNTYTPRASHISCILAISQIPEDHTPRIFHPSMFPIRYKYRECTLTLTLHQKDMGDWYSVDAAATNLWFTCQEDYPGTLRGATGVAGFHGRMFVRIWFESERNVTDDGVTAREISDGGMERDDEVRFWSDEG